MASVGERTVQRYRVSVEEYRSFRRDGYLVVRGLLSQREVEELLQHSEDLMYGRVEVPGLEAPPPGASPDELEKRILRIHMLHRHLEIQERYMLHPRVLDVLEALIGPDVLAMQTMLFIKAPGSQGQGYHQDTYYIPTFPDTLCGAWMALERADTENGCLWMCKGSQVEPIYPPRHGYGYGHWELSDIPCVSGVGGHCNDDEDLKNELRPVAHRYRDVEEPCILEAGDVAFFGGHVLHRSLTNRSTTRMRRALVCHYCNARSYTNWDGGNQNHILARGATTLPYAQPKFGTPCAANHPEKSMADGYLTPTMMMASEEGTMEAQEPNQVPHEH
ncbi:MAG TPA: phytanoyl-CoA dioxygenase family protein [Fimbriimonadaceae bacterium]|nr:phytanoyl-CoA dioxygenase family protein [Fimbriimonadaceae bacterium]